VLLEPVRIMASPVGNGMARAVHLTTAAVSCVAVLRVDLSVLRWYQKQAGLVGVLPNSRARAAFLR
jgi:hypothetical protein